VELVAGLHICDVILDFGDTRVTVDIVKAVLCLSFVKLPLVQLVETIHICGNRENLIELKHETVLTVSTVMLVTLDSTCM
jgi:hypothetical protein